MIAYQPIASADLVSFNVAGDHRDLHSFPTRRSSDLQPQAGVGREGGVAVAQPVFHHRRVADGGVLRQPQSLDNAEQRSEEHTSELQSLTNLVCRLLLEKKNKQEPVSEVIPQMVADGQ